LIHELSHAAHYNKVGNTWYNEFVNGVIAQMIANYNTNNSPYGTAYSADAPIIAVGEAWAYHMGHYMADLRYGVKASTQSEQPNTSYSPNGTNHPHIDVLENFWPLDPNDVFRWIPKGLMLDLIDITPNEKIGLIANADQANGYTNQKLYNALQSDVKSIGDYKNKLLYQNSNYQTIEVNNLVNVYGY
jgi:hypothetical protein